jgi:hypothetical protein
VGALDLLEVAMGASLELQRDVQPGGQQVVGNGVQPLRAFGVAGAHVVQAAVGMAVEHGAHRGISSPFIEYGARMDDSLTRQLSRLVDQISTIIVGKRPQIEDCMACLLAGGHLLIEDVPGVGKTTLAHALAVSLGLDFRACSSPPT